MDASKLDKLKVVDLRSELAARGLDTKGVKAVLVDRLRAALEQDNAEPEVETSSSENSNSANSSEASSEEVLSNFVHQAQNKVPIVHVKPLTTEEIQGTPSAARRSRRNTRSKTRSPSPSKKSEPSVSALDTLQEEAVPIETSFQYQSTALISQPVQDEVLEQQSVTDCRYMPEEYRKEENEPIVKPIEKIEQTENIEAKEEYFNTVKQSNLADVEMKEVIDEQHLQIDENKIEETRVEDEVVKNDQKMLEEDESQTKLDDDVEDQKSMEVDEAPNDNLKVDLNEDLNQTEAKQTEEKKSDRKRRHSRSRSRSKSRSKSRSRSRSSRSRSPRYHNRTRSPAKNADDFTNEEDEPTIEDKQFGLSWYDSDLHLRIDPISFNSAKPLSDEIFNLIWSGARTNYGLRNGKVCYEVRLSEETNCKEFRDEPHIKGFRCGFSVPSNSLTIGESEFCGPQYFAYCSTGKKVENITKEVIEPEKTTEQNEECESKKDEEVETDKIDDECEKDESEENEENDDNKSKENDIEETKVSEKSTPTIQNIAEFTDYGEPYGLDDIIGCYLDLDSTPCTIEFTRNGRRLGTAFEFLKEDVLGESNALFPHFLTKGYEFEVNFADNENLLGNKPRQKRFRRKIRSEELTESVSQSEPIDESNNDKKDIESESENSSKDKDSKMDVKDGNDESKTESDQNPDDTKESSEMKKDDKKLSDDDETRMSKEKKTSERRRSDESRSRRDSKRNESESEEFEEIEPEERDEVVLIPDYELIGLISEDSFVSGPQRPESRKECEVFLMVGLPGSGKTYWVVNHLKKNPDKRFDIIGADSLIEKMKVEGVPRKQCHNGKWDKVYELCLKCLPDLEDIATKRRRNFILDQNNVFASCQRRKMKGFGDFKRIAVVCIPNEDELKRRNELKNDEKDSSSNTIKESEFDKLRANFTLPSAEFGWFDEVRFTDLDGDAAKNEARNYNEKGKKAMRSSQTRDYKRQRRSDNYRRDDRRHRDDNDNRRRDDYRNNSRWKNNNNNGRRGPMNSGGGSRWGSSNSQSGGSGGHWRDDRRYGNGDGYGRRDRYGSGGGGGGGGGNWVNNRNRYDDRSQYRGSGSGSRYDSYSSSSRDYRSGNDRYDRDRNGSSSGRRDGPRRDFRAGHRELRTEDSRGGSGYERSSSAKYANTNDAYNKSTNSNSGVQGKWMQQQANWNAGGNQIQQTSGSGYWNFDQSQNQATYGTHTAQQQQQWVVNNVDARQQQQWMSWWQQQGAAANPVNQQYWSQYTQQAYVAGQQQQQQPTQQQMSQSGTGGQKK